MSNNHLNQIGLIHAITVELETQVPGIKADTEMFRAIVMAADVVCDAYAGDGKPKNYVVEKLKTRVNEQSQLVDRMIDIRDAAEKLVRTKGRYHSEQNYRALAKLFGVVTPDLPPVGGDLAPVTVTLPAPACTSADHGYPAYSEAQVLDLLNSLGVKVVRED